MHCKILQFILIYKKKLSFLLSEAKSKAKHGEGLIILAPNQILQRLLLQIQLKLIQKEQFQKQRKQPVKF